MKNNFTLFFITFFLFSLIQTNGKGQGVSINALGSSPDNSAMLDVSSNNRGLLIPRVALTGLSDQTTIASPAPYLTIYNTNAAIGNGAGMYYWNGSTWNYMASASNGTGSSGQVLTSQGNGHAPQWNPIPPSGGGGSICACFNGYQVFTSNGTFTTSSATTLVKVQAWGGGGGGGSSAYIYYGGAGGGGGGYAEGIFTVSPSTSYNVTVGTGGTGAAAGGNATGGTGGNSSFDILISATGGTGGSYNANSGGVPGQGGYGIGGYLNTTLGAGGNGGYYTSFPSQAGANNGGNAGGALYGGGGGGGPGGGNGGPYNTSGNNATDNSGAGGGGAGGSTLGNGGNGGSGLIIVYY